MSLQQKTFVETLKEKLKPGVKVYVTSKGAELFDELSALQELVIDHVTGDSENFLVVVKDYESAFSQLAFEKGNIATYDMLSPDDKRLLWKMSPNESYVDIEGDFKRYGEKEEIAGDENLVNDMVKNPKHYQLFEEFGLEIKDVNKRILDNIEKSDFDMTLYEASWWTQSSQYLLRFYEKGGVEDLKKCVQTLQFVIESMEERQKK